MNVKFIQINISINGFFKNKTYICDIQIYINC